MRIRKAPLTGETIEIAGGHSGNPRDAKNFRIDVTITGRDEAGNTVDVTTELRTATLVWLFKEIPPETISQIAAIAHGGAMVGSPATKELRLKL
jgi:hypothetical protein